MLRKLMSLQKTQQVDKDKIAHLLKVNPEVLKDFEQVYKSTSLEEDNIDEMNFFKINAKQMAKAKKNIEDLDNQVNDVNTQELSTQLSVIKNDIVKELLGNKNDNYIKPEDLKNIPLSLKPQLTGNLITKDMPGNSYEMLLTQYIQWQETGDIRFYHSFRQGLDILDLDPITYAIIDKNPNSMGFWFPAVSSAVQCTDFFKIPKTKIIKVPLPILQLTKLDYQMLNRTTLDIVNEYCMKVFDLDINKKYFIKTGTYSSKFDFRNALVQGEQEVRELGEYLLFIHHQAIQMASPLNTPVIYGVSTTNEWVVREFIDDVEDNPTIYKGMPLRTEYRFFVDFDSQEVLGVSPYWREDVMKKSFSQGEQDNHKKHDYIIYKMHEEKLYAKYNDNIDKLTQEISRLIKEINLPGQWSIDIMQNGEDFYIIDMALAHQSALNDCVEPGKLRIPTENWVPQLI